MGAELGGSDVDHYVAQLFLSPELLEHAEGLVLDVLGRVHLAVGARGLRHVPIGFCAALRAVHAAS